MKQKVYEALQKIPKGKVTTYKQLAEFTGYKNPRVIGNILHKNIRPEKYPCHRVVKSDGNVALGYAMGGKNAQIHKLREEGVPFIGDKVDLSRALCILTK